MRLIVFLFLFKKFPPCFGNSLKMQVEIQNTTTSCGYFQKWKTLPLSCTLAKLMGGDCRKTEIFEAALLK